MYNELNCIIVVVLFFLIDSDLCSTNNTSQCHPQCSYQCDAPVCNAVCVAVCLKPICRLCDILTNNTIICDELIDEGCRVKCPGDQCELDACPACEVHCSDDLCEDNPTCRIRCEMIECGWRCSKPDDCPKPVCELQCEQAACAIISDANVLKHHTSSFIFIMAMIIILF